MIRLTGEPSFPRPESREQAEEQLVAYERLVARYDGMVELLEGLLERAETTAEADALIAAIGWAHERITAVTAAMASLLAGREVER